jgi:hypothetical protein
MHCELVSKDHKILESTLVLMTLAAARLQSKTTLLPTQQYKSATLREVREPPRVKYEEARVRIYICGCASQVYSLSPNA